MSTTASKLLKQHVHRWDDDKRSLTHWSAVRKELDRLVPLRDHPAATRLVYQLNLLWPLSAAAAVSHLMTACAVQPESIQDIVMVIEPGRRGPVTFKRANWIDGTKLVYCNVHTHFRVFAIGRNHFESELVAPELQHAKQLALTIGNRKAAWAQRKHEALRQQEQEWVERNRPPEPHTFPPEWAAMEKFRMPTPAPVEPVPLSTVIRRTIPDYFAPTLK